MITTDLMPQHEQILRTAYALRKPPYLMEIDCEEVAKALGTSAMNIDLTCRLLAKQGLIRISHTNHLYLSSDGCDWVEWNPPNLIPVIFPK